MKKQKVKVVETTTSTVKMTALEEMVAAQLTDRQFSNNVSYENLTKKVTYVTARNGLFKVTKTAIGLFKELVQEFKTPIVGIPDMEAGVDLAIPKIPMKYIVEALSWYRDINTKDKTEASVLFFWNHKDVELPVLPGLREEGKLVIYCPVQENSSALSDFTMDENVAWFRENLALLLETHSHRVHSVKRSA